MPYMYILECADGSYYTGSTWNLEKRFAEHNAGVGANYTAKKLPVRLVYCEEFSRIDDAFYREKQVQGWSHAKKKSLIEANWESVRKLAECMNETHCKNIPFESSDPSTSLRVRAVSLRPNVAPFDSAQAAREQLAGERSQSQKENPQLVGGRSRTNRKEDEK